MAYFTPSTIAQYQQQITTAYNAKATKPANTGPGSSLGAIFNAVSLLAVQLQQQALYVAGVARLLTSANLDVDSFFAQFGFARNQATSAIFNNIVVGTPSPASSNILIPVGMEAQTPGGIIFQVIADPTHPSWNASLNGYVLGTGSSSCIITMQALVPGSGGNVQPGTITQILSIPGSPAPAGLSTINNPTVATTPGADQETDAAASTRFIAWITSRWAVQGAILAAVSGVQPGLTYQIGDLLDPLGNNTTPDAFFTVVVNVLGQSTGPSAGLITAVTNAIEASRACGLPYTVVGPQLVTVNGTVTIKVAAGADPTATSNAVQAAFAAFINNIGMGNLAVTPQTLSLGVSTCSFSKLLAALLAVAGVVTIPNGQFTLNGGTADITAAYGQQLVAGTLTVTTQ